MSGPAKFLVWRRLAVVALAIAMLAVLCWSLPATVRAAPPAAAGQPVVVKLLLHDTIQPISAEYLERGLAHADEIHASAALVELGTPGGMLVSTRKMVTAIVQAKTPVIVYVAPSGSRAGSAGFFILQAADVAAMAPGTEAGASHPILEGRKMGPILKEKIVNDATAFLRSYVTRRGRNVQAADDAVRHSKSYTDEECLKLNLIDLIAPDQKTLLQKLDGKTITRFHGEKQVLNLTNARVEVVNPSVRERILGALMDPNLAVILLIVGGLLIYLEFNAPGMVVPGVVGALLVLLSLFALNLLPLEYTAIAFLIAAATLFVLDIKFATHGILGVAAIGCLVFGLLTLVNGPIPQMRVHLDVALGAGIGFGVITIFLTAIAVRARRNKIQTGGDALLGELAIAQTALDPEGHIKVRGELWRARAASPIPAGESVRIRGRDGLLLQVERDKRGS